VLAIIGPHSIAFANIVVDAFQGMVQNDVKLDPISEDIDEWGIGDQAPLQMVGESESKLGHYHVFKYEREIQGSGFRSTGKCFGGVYDIYPR
jgi:hypothetical protein